MSKNAEHSSQPDLAALEAMHTAYFNMVVENAESRASDEEREIMRVAYRDFPPTIAPSIAKKPPFPAEYVQPMADTGARDWDDGNVRAEVYESALRSARVLALTPHFTGILLRAVS